MQQALGKPAPARLPRLLAATGHARHRSLPLLPRRPDERSVGAAAAAAPGDSAPSSSEWQAVADPATGRTYYWNTRTNATQWEPPVVVAAATPAPPPPPSSSSSSAPERGSFGGAAAAASAASPSDPEALLADLIDAMNADGSGMAFWEAARERRSQGVFEDSYIDWLTAKVERGGDEGEVAERVRARLVNPLLRQPAPFE